MEKSNNVEFEKKHTGINVAALTCGIISMLLPMIWYIALSTGILGIILGAKGAKKTGSAMAKAGIVTAIIGLVFFAIWHMFFIGAIILYNL